MYLHFDTARFISRIRNGELLKKKNTTQNLTEYAYFYFHFRLLVSGHLQKEHEFYMNFMEGGRTVKEFCSQVCVPLLNVKQRKNIVKYYYFRIIELLLMSLNLNRYLSSCLIARIIAYFDSDFQSWVP